MYHCERKTSLSLHKETRIIRDLQHWIHVPCGSFRNSLFESMYLIVIHQFHLHHVAMLELMQLPR